MNTSESVAKQIKVLAEEIALECSGNIAHMDMLLVQDIAQEVERLQWKLREIESRGQSNVSKS